MRKLCILAVLLPQFTLAQVFTSVTIGKVHGSEPGNVRMAGLSPDGRYALVTTMGNGGLERVSLDNGERVRVTDEPGAGFQPVMSDDGQLVMHCCDTRGDDHLLRTAVEVRDVEAGTVQRVTEPVRELRAFRLVGSQAEVDAGGQTLRRRVSARQRVAASRPTVTCDDLRLQLTRDGRTVTLAPNGDDEDTHYIWASVSPDGTRILYHVSGEGTYVCGLEGEDVQFVAYDCLAPQWYDDNTIVGMVTRDSELSIVSSAIVAYTLDGARQQLTPESDVLLYPYCSARAGRIVCARGNGEMVMLSVAK